MAAAGRVSGAAWGDRRGGFQILPRRRIGAAGGGGGAARRLAALPSFRSHGRLEAEEEGMAVVGHKRGSRTQRASE
jgi:hypothetical protein